jgi:GntR family phosphonate transport system transcriptional regulator
MGKSQYAEIVDTLVDDLAARLERTPGSAAHCVVRQGWINGMPSGWVIEWIPDDVYPDGADVALRAVESLDQGRHVWLVESVSRDAKRSFPIMTSIWWARPDVVRVIVEMGNACPR